ncbi:AI-2E family transporter [Luteimonas pelagia]
MSLPQDGVAAPAPHPDAEPGPPPPPRPRASTAMVVLAVLAVAYTLYLAQDLVLPVLLAMFFALVGNPVIRALERLWLPRFLAALLVVLAGLAGVAALGVQLMEPAGEWLREAPAQLRELAPTLREMTRPMQEANQAAEDIARAAAPDAGEGDKIEKVAVVPAEEASPYAGLLQTPMAIISVLAIAILALFFMVYGGRIQRSAISMLPSRQQKRVTVDLLHSIEQEVSRYVLTITTINLVLGAAYAASLFFLLDMPLGDVLLWGTMVALLNYAPYVGPLIGFVVMGLVGLIAYGQTWMALGPVGIYVVLQVLEGNFITPIVVGSRMSVSPLILMLALAVFGWMWGIVGLLLAVPLLVCFKLVLERLEGGEGWAKLLE